jgi:hypothetical protein
MVWWEQATTPAAVPSASIWEEASVVYWDDGSDNNIAGDHMAKLSDVVKLSSTFLNFTPRKPYGVAATGFNEWKKP